MENNNMISVKGFRMSGKFGELNLDELTLPCTKEAWDILGNLAETANDAAEECLDTSEFKPTKEIVTCDNGVKKVREKLSLDSIKEIYNSLSKYFPATETFKHQAEFDTEFPDERIYVYVTLLLNEWCSGVSVTIHHFNDAVKESGAYMTITQHNDGPMISDSSIDYIKTLVESFKITDESWVNFKNTLVSLLDNEVYRKFMSIDCNYKQSRE